MFQSAALSLLAVLLLLIAQPHAAGALQPLSARYSLSGIKLPSDDAIHSADSDLTEIYKAYTLQVPVDHFHNSSKYEPHSHDTFPLRYWFDASNYWYGGPVFLLLAGEANGTERLPTLYKGIIQKLARANHGVGVLLEHRFYGASQPMPDLSVESLRFLDTQQAMADVAYFAENVEIPGLDALMIDPQHTAWVVYGGSYAGAMSAFLRVLYPKTFWGAISSSGVPKAIVDYWEYFEAVRLYGPAKCVSKAQRFLDFFDSILLLDHTTPLRPTLLQSLKDLFGMGPVESELEFVDTVSVPVGLSAWQRRNWDPKIGSSLFHDWCKTVESASVLYPDAESKRSEVEGLLEVAPIVEKIGADLVNTTLNWIGYINQTRLAPCIARGKTPNDCFSVNETFWRREDLSAQEWRSWTWQVCSQWGYLTPGSTVPKHIRPLRSRAATLEHNALPCKVAFNRTVDDIDVGSINQYGGLDIGLDTPRLALIDGQMDPWLYAGFHAPLAPQRTDHANTPWVELEGAVHHWDENSLLRNETSKTPIPETIQQIQSFEELFVQVWVEGMFTKVRQAVTLLKMARLQ